MNRLPYHSTYWKADHLILILLFSLACYWPLSFWVFSAKNDNITAFLPVRFQVSEALRSGHLPLWSPYMYLGYPIHGDMQGGAWNPVVWLLSVFGRYNLVSLHAEILIYIFLAGAGMYRLLGSLKLDYSVRLAGATVYLMSGFITDVAGSNLPFLASASFLPFLLAFSYELLASPGPKIALKTAVSAWLLLVCGYPSFFICTGYIIISAFIVLLIKKFRENKLIDIRPVLLYAGFTLLVFLLLSGPAIISYAGILPFYHRSQGVTETAAQYNSFHPSCLWSYLLPAAPVKNPLSQSTDLISRNGYFNLFFLILVFTYPFSKKSRLKNFLLAGIIFFLLFSLGSFTPVRTWAYHLLPLMDTFRHPANARLYVILAGIALGCLLFNDLNSSGIRRKYLTGPALAITFLILGVFIFSLTKSHLSVSVNELFSRQPGRNSLKDFFDSLGIYDLVAIQAGLQIIFLAVWLVLIRKNSERGGWIILIVLNSFILAQFTAPYTLASKTPPGTINSLIQKFPKGYPQPDPSKTIAENSVDALDNLELIGINSFYNKKIAIANVQYTPTILTAIQNIMNDSVAKSAALSKPYAYFNDNRKGRASFVLSQFSNNRFSFLVATTDTMDFCLQQVLLPGWNCFMDDNKIKIEKVNDAFMKVAVPAGSHELKFIYQPVAIWPALIVSIGCLLVISVLLLKRSDGAI